MARESYFEFACNNYSDKIIDIIDLFSQIGWNHIDFDGMTEYIPLGDKDDYDWQTLKMPYDALKKMITTKQLNKERVGVILYEHEYKRAVTFLAENTKTITLNIDVYRKSLNGNADNFLDANWYIQNIFQRLSNKGVVIDNIKFEDYLG